MSTNIDKSSDEIIKELLSTLQSPSIKETADTNFFSLINFKPDCTKYTSANKNNADETNHEARLESFEKCPTPDRNITLASSANRISAKEFNDDHSNESSLKEVIKRKSYSRSPEGNDRHKRHSKHKTKSKHKLKKHKLRDRSQSRSRDSKERLSRSKSRSRRNSHRSRSHSRSPKHAISKKSSRKGRSRSSSREKYSYDHSYRNTPKKSSRKVDPLDIWKAEKLQAVSNAKESTHPDVEVVGEKNGLASITPSCIPLPSTTPIQKSEDIKINSRAVEQASSNSDGSANSESISLNKSSHDSEKSNTSTQLQTQNPSETVTEDGTNFTHESSNDQQLLSESSSSVCTSVTESSLIGSKFTTQSNTDANVESQPNSSASSTIGTKGSIKNKGIRIASLKDSVVLTAAAEINRQKDEYEDCSPSSPQQEGKEHESNEGENNVARELPQSDDRDHSEGYASKGEDCQNNHFNKKAKKDKKAKKSKHRVKSSSRSPKKDDKKRHHRSSSIVSEKTESKSVKKSEEGHHRDRKHSRRSRSREKRRHRSRERSESASRDENKFRDKSHHHERKSGSSRSKRSRSREKRKKHRSRSPLDVTTSLHSRKRSRISDEGDDCVKALKDKVTRKRLLDIARRNAVQMVANGQLVTSSGAGSSAGVAPSVYPTHGKSVQDLTEFCKQLVQSGEYSDGDEDNGVLIDEDCGRDGKDHETKLWEDPAFTYTGRHPFMAKDKPIMMNIRNAPMLPTKTNAERLVESSKLREQFPVSSGSHHREKDIESEWVPVDPKDRKPKAITNTTMEPGSITQAPVEAPPPDTPAPPPAPADTVFPVLDESSFNIDLSEIVSARLSAMRKLQENPNDRDAKEKLNSVQKTMSNWALSKQEPGRFTGSTGVKVLSVDELSAGQQAWAKKEQLKTAAPVSSHFGMRMLQKMGWNPGEGLGKNKEGSTIPLMLDIKMDKKGFHAQEELASHKPSIPMTKSLAGKHPVSALVELCSKRKWGPPQFDVVFDNGPDHKKNYLMKVTVNGQEYKASHSSSTKKMAKAEAAAACLMALGTICSSGAAAGHQTSPPTLLAMSASTSAVVSLPQDVISGELSQAGAAAGGGGEAYAFAPPPLPPQVRPMQRRLTHQFQRAAPRMGQRQDKSQLLGTFLNPNPIEHQRRNILTSGGCVPYSDAASNMPPNSSNIVNPVFHNQVASHSNGATNSSSDDSAKLQFPLKDIYEPPPPPPPLPATIPLPSTTSSSGPLPPSVPLTMVPPVAPTASSSSIANGSQATLPSPSIILPLSAPPLPKPTS